MTNRSATLTGVGVSPGRVVGVIRRMPHPIAEPPAGPQPGTQTTPERETERLRAAAREVQAALKRRADGTDGDARAVLEATAIMAVDPMLITTADTLIARGASAERAVWEAAGQAAEMLKGLGGYMAERAQDVMDVRSRIVAQLRGVPAPGIPASDTPFILVAEDLAPADTATLDPAVVVALVTGGGGPQSHTAILARALGLPAVVAVQGANRLEEGTTVFVDGAAGAVIVEPGPDLVAAAARWAEEAGAVAAFIGPGATADGHLVPLLANVSSGKDARAAALAGAEGVGLLRTEFCFLDRASEPPVQEQAQAYGEVFAAFPERKVVVRTLDAGADKPLPFLSDAREPNPALGVRGYRTDLTSPGVLERQLQAIAMAAAAHSADVWVMAPMISTAEESRRFAEMCTSAGLKTPGVMIEVPSAALTARTLLREVAFASIGTNDLTQYAMAADRQLGALAALNDPWQPAVLELIRITVAGAAANGTVPVGVCGEAAADPALAVVLAGLGVNSLSMTARALPGVAAALRSVTLEQAQELASIAVNADSASAGRAGVRAKLPVLVTDPQAQ